MEEMKKKVVIVEDETDILQLLNLILVRAGYEVHACDNGRNALPLIKKVRPHLVILDLMLPGLDGRTIVEEMAKDEDVFGTPVMVTSALEEAGQMFAGNPIVKDYCYKPFRTSVLLQKVKKIMGDE